MTTIHHWLTPEHLAMAEATVGTAHGLYRLTWGALRLLLPGTGRHRRC
ncbi:hypothetical protein ACWCQN_24235 [Streptomyces sp. NPDC001984]